MAMPVPLPLMPDTSRRDWTVAERNALPDDGNRYEVVDGELLVSPSPSLLHQIAVAELFAALREYVRAHEMVCVMAPADVTFSPRRVVQPDLLVAPFVQGRQPSRLEEIRRLVLAAEVLSPTTARADRYVKRRLYQSEGVREYWIVDTESRFVERWHPGDDAPEVVTESLAWSAGEEAEPLVIDLAAYFRRVHGEP